MMLKEKFTLIRDLPSDKIRRPCAATIGNFDGLHRGHQHIIEKLVTCAHAKSLVPTVITFEPPPHHLLHPGRHVMKLSSLSEKITLLKKWGVSQLVCLRFNQTLANKTAHEFIDHILCHTFNVKYLIIGEDFRFGHKQSGDSHLLVSVSKEKGFEVDIASLEQEESFKISSTAIRESLMNNRWEKATSLLGRRFSITRRVIRGHRRGHVLGFPTANIPLKINETALKGVFITRARVEDKYHWAVSNLGTRPSVEGKHYLLETHLLDFTGDLYGKRLTVEFFQKIRDEKRFDTLTALQEQIGLDIEHAKQWINKIK